MKKYLPLLLLAGLFIFSACSLTNNTKNTSRNSTPIDSSVNLTDGVYQIDTTTSLLSWKAERVVGGGHVGTVDLKNGQITVAKNEFTQGNFIIDMTRIKESNKTAALITHLESADFFDVSNYPEAQFELTKMLKKSEASNIFLVEGNLTIKDKTNPISFEAQVNSVGGDLKVEGQFSIDRTKWDIRYGSNKFFNNLGDKVINDNIDYSVSIIAKLIK